MVARWGDKYGGSFRRCGGSLGIYGGSWGDKYGGSFGKCGGSHEDLEVH